MIKNEFAFTYTSFTRFQNSPFKSNKVISLVENVNYKYLLSNSVIVTSSVMINKNYTGYFEMQNVYYDDFVLWLQLLKKTKYAYCINSCLLYYRISKNSLSNNKIKSAKIVYRIFKSHLNLNLFESHFYFIKWIFNTTIRYIYKY